MTVLADLEKPSGYATHDEYFATMYEQGGRTIYSVDVSLPELVGMIAAPDPEVRVEGNRQITVSHAESFAEYLRERDNWVCPRLLLRAPQGEFNWKLEWSSGEGGTRLGRLGIPKLARDCLNITDGQHRVLGFHRAWHRLNDDIQKAREHLARAKSNGEDPALISEAEKQVKRLLQVRDTWARQRIGLDIMIVDDPKAYKQVFVDIAENAKGISRSLSARFDTSKVVNRALALILDHPLLEGRVNEESDRAIKKSPYLMGAKNVADIIRYVQVGPFKRVSRSHEKTLSDLMVAANSRAFFDVITDAFPDFQGIVDGTMTPEKLRSSSLLGSAVMLRILAGVYGELVVVNSQKCDPKVATEEVGDFFAALNGHLSVPVGPGSPWLETECFLEGTSAPSARQGDITKLSRLMIDWASKPETRPAWLVSEE